MARLSATRLLAPMAQRRLYLSRAASSAPAISYRLRLSTGPHHGVFHEAVNEAIRGAVFSVTQARSPFPSARRNATLLGIGEEILGVSPGGAENRFKLPLGQRPQAARPARKRPGSES